MTAPNAKKSSSAKSPSKPVPKASAKLISHVGSIVKILKKTYPDAKCELDFKTPIQLLVATILSAQCTDKRVNLVTPALFKKYKTVDDFAKADQEELEKDIHSTGFYRNKAKNIIAASKIIRDQYSSRVPDTMDALAALPGVGRKTANVILGSAYGKNEGIVVDTHVIRLSNRFGMTTQQDPVKIEYELMPLLLRDDWSLLGHLITWHGRRRCFARKPDCHNCELQKLCPSYPVED